MISFSLVDVEEKRYWVGLEQKRATQERDKDEVYNVSDVGLRRSMKL